MVSSPFKVGFNKLKLFSQLINQTHYAGNILCSWNYCPKLTNPKTKQFRFSIVEGSYYF